MATLELVLDGESPFDFTSLSKKVYEKLRQTDELAIELSFVGGEEIRTLNRVHRNVDKVTDVLSFPYLDGIKGKTIKCEEYADEVEDGRLLIGSVCVCTEKAEEQAKEYGHSLKREIFYLVLHGILHCFGYDHIAKEEEDEMTATAEEIMQELSLTREV